jgi:hypothetical protein
MPKKKPIEKAKQALRQGKSPSTAAGEFIRDEIDRSRHGEGAARTPKQAIAIGLAKARRAGIPLRPQPESAADERARQSVERAYEVGKKKKRRAPSRKRARAAPATRKRKRKSAVSSSTKSARPSKVAAPRRKRAATHSAR